MNKHLAVLIYLLIDIIWITINKKTYGDNIKNIQNENMQVKIIPAILAYTLLVFNIYVLLIPRLKNEFEFAMIGMVIYGVYNMTNQATFKDYPLSISLLDTAWGTFSHYILGFMIFM